MSVCRSLLKLSEKLISPGPRKELKINKLIMSNNQKLRQIKALLKILIAKW